MRRFWVTISGVTSVILFCFCVVDSAGARSCCSSISDAQMDKVTAGDASHVNFIMNNGQDFILKTNQNNFNCHNIAVGTFRC